jgi:hypothetical protein
MPPTFHNADEMELTDGTNEHEAGGSSFAKKSRRAVYSLRVPGTPHWPESTGSMKISSVTSKNVNGKEVQAFGGDGLSDWKIPWPKSEILHLLAGSMAHTIQSLGDAVLVCSRTRRRKRTLTSAFGPVQEMWASQWFAHQTKLKPCHVKISSQDSKKKERSKH